MTPEFLYLSTRFILTDQKLTFLPILLASGVTSLGLGKNTTSSLQSFRKRSEDARRALTALQAQSTEVDFAHYKSTLKVRIVSVRRHVHWGLG